MKYIFEAQKPVYYCRHEASRFEREIFNTRYYGNQLFKRFLDLRKWEKIPKYVGIFVAIVVIFRLFCSRLVGMN